MSTSQTVIKIKTYDEKLHKYFLAILVDSTNIETPLGIKEENGFYNLKYARLDSLKIYRLYLDDARFKKISIKLNIKSKDTIIVNLEPNPDCNCKTFAPNLIVKNCQFYETGSYVPEIVRRLEYLPKIISVKLEQYLIQIVGKKFYKRLYFKRAQIINTSQYGSDYYDQKSKFHYKVCFAFSDTKNGLGEYTSIIELDDFGNITDQVNLPKNNNDLNYLQSIDKLKFTPEVKTFYKEGKTKIDIAYEPIRNILVWKFINEYNEDNGVYLEQQLIFNAHNGKFIELKDIHGQWVE